MKIESLKEEIKNVKRTKAYRIWQYTPQTRRYYYHHWAVYCDLRRRRFCRYGGIRQSRKEFLAKFLELPNGIPDSDTFRQVFEKINPPELSSCLINWVSAERGRRSVVAIDGKTIRGSADE